MCPLSAFHDNAYCSRLFRNTSSDASSTRPTEKQRVKSMELNSGVVRGKLPLNLAGFRVTFAVPGRKFGVKHIQTGNTTTNALTCQHTDHYLGNVEPASMFGCIVHLKTFCQRPGIFSRKRFIERSDDMRVKIVDNESDFGYVGKMYGQ